MTSCFRTSGSTCGFSSQGMLNQQEAGSVQQDPAAPVGIIGHKWLPCFAGPNMIQLQSYFQN